MSYGTCVCVCLLGFLISLKRFQTEKPNTFTIHPTEKDFIIVRDNFLFQKHFLWKNENSFLPSEFGNYDIYEGTFPA